MYEAITVGKMIPYGTSSINLDVLNIRAIIKFLRDPELLASYKVGFYNANDFDVEPLREPFYLL